MKMIMEFLLCNDEETSLWNMATKGRAGMLKNSDAYLDLKACTNQYT